MVRLSTWLGSAWLPAWQRRSRYGVWWCGTVRRGATRARKKHRNAFPSFSAPSRPLPPSSLVPPHSLSPFSSSASSPKSSCGSSPRDKIASRLSRLLLPRGCYSGVFSLVFPSFSSSSSSSSSCVSRRRCALGCRFHASREWATDRSTDQPTDRPTDRPTKQAANRPPGVCENNGLDVVSGFLGDSDTCTLCVAAMCRRFVGGLCMYRWIRDTLRTHCETTFSHDEPPEFFLY